MDAKTFGNCYNAEDGANNVWVFGPQNFACADFSQFLNRTKVVCFQPIRQAGVSAFLAREFNDCDYRVRVPIWSPASRIDIHEMRNRRIGSFAHVSLVM